MQYRVLNSEQELDNFYSLENLELAWVRVNSSPILDSKDRLGLRVFAAQRDNHLKLLREQLQNHEYEPQSPAWMYSVKDNRMLRPHAFLEIQDRIVYQAIGNIIIENSYADIVPYANKTIFAHVPNPRMRDSTYNRFVFRRPFSSKPPLSSIKGQYRKFIDAVFSDIKQASQSQDDIWILQTDVASYYPSIDHRLILGIRSEGSYRV
jgi:hypothetical protein